jgi:hypothetical protein
MFRHFSQGVPRALKLLSGGTALCYYISGFQPFASTFFNLHFTNFFYHRSFREDLPFDFCHSSTIEALAQMVAICILN